MAKDANVPEPVAYGGPHVACRLPLARIGNIISTCSSKRRLRAKNLIVIIRARTGRIITRPQGASAPRLQFREDVRDHERRNRVTRNCFVAEVEAP